MLAKLGTDRKQGRKEEGAGETDQALALRDALVGVFCHVLVSTGWLLTSDYTSHCDIKKELEEI